ncbi:hypothetical protein AYI72_00265 [Shewanella algae]|jgi:hypothetical protein|nr:hypothetical protein BS332_20375 [Shewanella algae]AYV14188.1 hypothetical protein EEY24_15670 [Shewanella algae]OHY54622.1 hypothetical protein BEH76_15915 [Shewanella algae]PSS69052.1 hypothetical protein AYI88_18855 [Shewanella algae]PSS69832.1 hypothetical protein AYI85_09770 [Shewanella algae]
MGLGSWCYKSGASITEKLFKCLAKRLKKSRQTVRQLFSQGETIERGKRGRSGPLKERLFKVQ